MTSPKRCHSLPSKRCSWPASIGAKSSDDVLIITDSLDDNLYLSSRNLPNVQVLEARHADPVSLVHAAQVIITKGAVKHLEEALA